MSISKSGISGMSLGSVTISPPPNYLYYRPKTWGLKCQKWQSLLPFQQMVNYVTTSDRSSLKVILALANKDRCTEVQEMLPARFRRHLQQLGRRYGETSHTAARPLRRSVPPPLHSTPSAPAGRSCHWRRSWVRRSWGIMACRAAAKRGLRLGGTLGCVYMIFGGCANGSKGAEMCGLEGCI